MIKEDSTQGKIALTERENEIARLAAQGLPTKKLANVYIFRRTP